MIMHIVSTVSLPLNFLFIKSVKWREIVDDHQCRTTLAQSSTLPLNNHLLQHCHLIKDHQHTEQLTNIMVHNGKKLDCSIDNIMHWSYIEQHKILTLPLNFPLHHAETKEFTNHRCIRVHHHPYKTGFTTKHSTNTGFTTTITRHKLTNSKDLATLEPSSKDQATPEHQQSSSLLQHDHHKCWKT